VVEAESEIAFALPAAMVVRCDLVENLTIITRGVAPAQQKIKGSVTQLTRCLRSRAAYLSGAASRLRVGGVCAMEGAMLKAILCDESVSQVEIDQRARDARLRLEQIERLLVSRAAVTVSRLRRVLCLFSFARPGEGWRASRTQGPLSNRRPRVPQIHPGWVPSAP